MKEYKIYFLIAISLLFQTNLYSSRADTTSILDNIYNYDFRLASDRLSKLNEKNQLLVQTLNLEKSWWIAIENGDRDQFSGFLKTLKQFENSSCNDIDKIVSATYRMRYYSCVKRNYMIPLLFLKIKKHIENVDVNSLKSTNREGYELFILYNSFLTLVQNSYFPEILLHGKGNRLLLIANIDEVIENGAPANKTIGRYFLMKYYLEIEGNKPKAFTYLSELHNQYPNNKVFLQLLTN